jgi:monoamine oxidase
MARSPLLALLRRSFQHARRSRDSGLPLDVVTHEYEQTRAARRKFLGALGAGAVATAGGVPMFAFGQQAPRIAIIGAGIAGLNCALELADRGIAATVYEASNRVGGRMFSNRRYWDDDQVSEWGGELIDTSHKTIRRLARRFGLVLDDLLAAEAPGSEETYFFLGNYYTEAQAAADFLVIADRVAADLRAAPFPTTYDAFTPEAQALDHLSVYDWIESRVPGGHGSPLGRLLDIAYTIEYAADTREQSSLNLLYLLGFQPNPKGFAKFGESDERFHIRGGNDQLPQAIARSLGAAVRLNTRLAAIRRTAGGAYRLALESGSVVKDVTADIVVLALPFAVLSQLDHAQAGFDTLKLRAIQEQGRGRSGKLQLQFRERFWNRRGSWPGISTGGGDSDTGYQESWETSRAQPGARGIITFFSGGSVADSAFTRQAFGTAANPLVAADAARVLRQAAPVYPPAPSHWNGKATQSLWHLNPFAGLSYAYYKPGQYTGFAGYEQQRQGGVFFCGEHTSIEFQGFMEGGAAEGERAAREVLRAIA